MVDPDPYKIAIVPEKLGKLARGTVLVSTSATRWAQRSSSFIRSPRLACNSMQSQQGCRDQRICPSIAANLLAANSKGGNSIQVLNADGTLFTSITNPLFNNPWE